MALVLTCISVQAVEQLGNGVTPLAKRLELDIGLMTSMIAASFHTKE